MPGPYELYVIRHGVAEERGDRWPDDSKRPLTEQGMARLAKAARGLVRLGVEFDVILTSPFVRTRQTAEVVARAFDHTPSVIPVDALAPGGGYQAIVDELSNHARRSRIALVGHEPGVRDLAARLLRVRHAFEFKKGAICRIDVDTIPPDEAGVLRWFMTTRILRRVCR